MKDFLDFLKEDIQARILTYVVIGCLGMMVLLFSWSAAAGAVLGSGIAQVIIWAARRL